MNDIEFENIIKWQKESFEKLKRELNENKLEVITNIKQEMIEKGFINQ